MLLKSLELQGYKTFAGKTLFEFADTITAIVGPNGSGKSNIADSLRWVLGEQSYRLLRGKKTADMIFSGSDQRPRAGMASATILFDNSEGWLPIDFSEVAITRRAYRDGQNEYLINGQRVRLKDVSDLLAKSGLSQRTYTIIGQGLVDAALSLKADERRSLFEEAAGIGLYRSRKQESLKRLENTRRNIERVEDILSELRPRVRSLEKQAKRAREFKQVQKDLHVLLREWYGYHWFMAQRELNAAKESLQTYERNLNQAKQKEEELDLKIKRDREQIQSLRTQLSGWHRELSRTHGTREGLTRRIAVLDERMRSVSNQLEAAKQDATRLQDVLEENRLRLKDAETDHAQAAKDLEDARVKAMEIARIIEEKKQRIQALENKIRGLEKQRYQLNDRKVHLNAKLSERTMQRERYQQEIADLTQKIQKLASEKGGASSAVEKAKHALDVALKNEQRLRQELDQREKALDEALSNRKVIEEKIAAKEQRLTKLKTQKNLLEQAENDLVDYAKGARVIMKYARSGKITGMKGTLSSRLVIPEKYETAIAAVLGEYIDAILIESRDPSRETLNILSKEAARGILIPLAEVVPFRKISAFTGQAGVIGIASELVSGDDEIRPTVDLLLGQVLLVEDRETAARMLPELPKTARVVTLRGEVFHASGPIMAGVSGERTKLSRPRQRIEIGKQIADLVKSLDESRKKLAEQNRLLEKKQIAIDKLREKVRNAEKEVNQARETHRKSLFSLDKLTQQESWLDEKLGSFRLEIDTLEKDLSGAKKEIKETDEALANLEQDLHEAKEQRSQYLLDEHLEQESFWKAQIAFDEKTLTQVQALKIERAKKVREVEENSRINQEKIRSLSEELQKLSQEKTELHKREKELSDAVAALQGKIKPAEQSLKSIEQGQSKLLGIESSTRKELSKAERQFSQAQLNLTRKQEKLENIKERIENDFGLVDYEYAKDINGPKPLPFDGLVEQLQIVRELPKELGSQIKELRHQLRRMRSINLDAQDEYEEVKERFDFMTAQINDLQQAAADIREVIAELDSLMEKEFRKTFDAVSIEFRDIFKKLFGGGAAKLILTDPDDLIETGIDIEARLPGRRPQGLSLLSGGERSLTAVSLIFALLRVSPTPFCVLDEVDAMLDETNVGRFRDLIKELSENTQFIVITHNRNTVQAADVIYGITMGADSASQVISLKLDELPESV